MNGADEWIGGGNLVLDTGESSKPVFASKTND